MAQARAELILIRHAPVAVPGRLAGRTDFPARIEADAVAALRAMLPDPQCVITSPARRCVSTAQALFPDHQAAEDARLWEQNFGRYDGAALSDLPDIGELDGPALAAHRWPGGESFDDLCDRIAPALSEIAKQAVGPVAVVAHAGVIRAALGQVLGARGGALAFEIAPLSATRLGVWQGAAVSVRQVNGGGL
ncbi:histidine phosphatase family protein [Sagittula sp. SSi028]|uniref:histidine phosphatase family protein n=1 Tax=Sagittula sp. SSi028 TaxID=3400636 RepID=UPI003AF8EC16